MTYTPEHDYNNAEAGGGSFDLIPANTIAPVILTIRPGGIGEDGWLTQSNTSDAQYLSCEFTIIEGEFAKRKFWTNFTVAGGKVNEKGESIASNISRSTLRAILESSRGIRPDDETDAAKKKRLVAGYSDFDQMQFIAKVGIEPARGEFQARNKLLAVITPDKPEYGGAAAQPAPASKPAWAGQSNGEQKAQSDAPAWAQ